MVRNLNHLIIITFLKIFPLCCAINKRLLEITNTLREAWSLFESDLYNWDELCNMLRGGKPEEGVMGFIEDALRPVMKLSTYQSYKYSYRALLKALGRDSLTFKELNYDPLKI